MIVSTVDKLIALIADILQRGIAKLENWTRK